MAKKPPKKKIAVKKTAKKTTKKSVIQSTPLLVKIASLETQNAALVFERIELKSTNAILMRVIDRLTTSQITSIPNFGNMAFAPMATAADTVCTITTEKAMLAVVLDALRKDYDNPNLGENSSLKATGDDPKTVELRFFPINDAILGRGCALKSIGPSDIQTLDIIGKIAAACWKDLNKN